MIEAERNLFILRSINARGVINIKEIAQELGISETTVRRDFEKLERAGKLKRVQGGATLHKGTGDLDNAQLAMSEKRLINVPEKESAAQYAASLIQDGEHIFLDCGTSIVPLAERLLGRQVKIVTINTLLLHQSKTSTADIFLSGGRYHSHYNMMYGPLAIEALERFSFDHAFISCFGIALKQGKAYTLDVDTQHMKRVAMRRSRQSHLLLDTSKLDREGFYAFAELSQFTTVICNDAGSIPPDNELPPNFVRSSAKNRDLCVPHCQFPH